MRNLIRRFILFLVRRQLGVKKYTYFRFVGQKSDAVYYFTPSDILKRENVFGKIRIRQSSVSLNWLLNPNCEIEEVLYENLTVYR